MRTFGSLFVGGVAALVLFKLFAALVLPMIGIFVGLILLVFKIALIGAVAYFVYSVVRSRGREQAV